jgi:drug/metabolite transporter (DMT)-like permease
MKLRLLVLVAVACMAAATLLMRAALEFWPVGLAGTVSRMVSTVAIAIWALPRGTGWGRFAPRGTGGWIVLMAVIATTLTLLLFVSLRYTTATNQALLYRLDVVFVVLIGTVLGLERIGWRELLLLPVMLLGVAMVAEVRFSSLRGHMIGDLMVVAAALGLAADAFIVRHILRTLDLGVVSLMIISLPGLGFLGFMLVENELATIGDRLWNRQAWLWVVLLGLVNALFLPIYYAVLCRMPIWRLRIWMLLAPPLVAVADRVFWHTQLSAGQFVGMGLVLLGLVGVIYLERNGASVTSPQDAESSTADGLRRERANEA